MHAPVSTFEHKGKQYVIAFSAGNALIGSARGDSVWLFGLEGTLPPAEPGTPVPRSTAIPAVEATRAAEAAAPAPEESRIGAAASLANGQRLFEQACVICHGADGKGGHGGGAPLDRLTDLAATIQTVTAGRDNMPPFRGTFTADQIRDVSAYVVGGLAKSGGR
jgi:mono/diheme cytochrome c family protein